jgi:hypothetical protein
MGARNGCIEEDEELNRRDAEDAEKFGAAGKNKTNRQGAKNAKIIRSRWRN